MKEEKKNMGKEANAGLVKRDDSSTATRLLDKNWSPLTIRKFQAFGWPLFIGIISDASLDFLDELVLNLSEEAEKHGFLNGTIQGTRNFCGFLSDGIVNHLNQIKRGCAEGVMVCFYSDKNFCSAAWGDLMTHEKCVSEFYSILNMMTHI